MVFGFGGSKQVAETEAEGEIERVYHEIKQSMRVSGINLNFRTWAGFDRFFPVMWDSMRPLAETRAFEDAADEIRRESVNLAGKLGNIDAKAKVNLGESQAYQIQKALALYHYINPKLLVFTAKVKQALAGEAAQGNDAAADTALIERGIPVRMYPMEMIAAEPENDRLAAIFADIKATLSLASINSDYRTLALWPDYLEAVWRELKPVVLTEAYQKASDGLRETARGRAERLPAISLSKQQIENLGEDTGDILEMTEKFEQLLPSLTINISLLSLDWQPAEVVSTSPFPAESKQTGQGGTGPMNWREFQTLQKAAEVGERFVSYIDEGAGEPVILIHGIPTWGYLWHKLIPVLSKQDRVLAPDLIGFGYSDKRDTFDRSIARQAEMIDAWMEKIGIASANIVAHDIGGGVALRLAAHFPRRIKKLCLMNSVCYDSWPIEAMLQLGHPGAYYALSAPHTVTALQQMLKLGFYETPDDEILDGILTPYSTEVGKLSLIRNAAALNTNLTAEITHLLHKIGVKTSILWGADDKFQLLKFGKRLADDMPNAELIPIENARHFVMIDQPEAVARQVSTFLVQDR